MSSSSDKSHKPHSLLDGLVSYYPMTSHPMDDPFTTGVCVWDRMITKKERSELYWAGFSPFERRIKRYFLYPTRLINVWWYTKRFGRFIKRIW